MTRSAIISCIIHLMIIIVTMSLPKNPMPEIGNIGTIQVRMSSGAVGRSTETKKGSNSLENRSETRAEAQAKKPLEKPKEKEVKKVETVERSEKIAKKTIKPEDVVVIKETKDEKPKKEITENLEKISEKLIKEDDLQDEKAREENQEHLKTQVVKGKESTEISETNSTGDKNAKVGIEDGSLGEDLIKLSDGSIAVKHQGVKGLSYGFVSNPEPSYPSRARRLGFKGDMTVKVILQFDSNGRLENMKFIDEKDKFGFTGEVAKAVKNWRLSPITYSGRSVKMRFYKSFKFEKQG